MRVIQFKSNYSLQVVANKGIHAGVRSMASTPETINLPVPHRVRSPGSSAAIRTSKTGPCSSSLRTEPILGDLLSEWAMTMRCSHAEAVFSRSEANRASPSIKSSKISQLRNARVLSEGEAEGLDSKGERRRDKSDSWPMVNVSMAGKDGAMEHFEAGEG